MTDQQPEQSEDIPSTINALECTLEEGEELLLETESFRVVGKEFLSSRELFSNYDRNFDHVWVCLSGQLTIRLFEQEVHLTEGDVQRIPCQTSYGNVQCKGGTRVLVFKGK